MKSYESFLHVLIFSRWLIDLQRNWFFVIATAESTCIYTNTKWDYFTIYNSFVICNMIQRFSHFIQLYIHVCFSKFWLSSHEVLGYLVRHIKQALNERLYDGITKSGLSRLKGGMAKWRPFLLNVWSNKLGIYAWSF